MTDQEVKLVLGALLHDIGKVIYRQGGDRRKHSRSGYDFLKDEVQVKRSDVGSFDEEVLNCVLYHHADALKNAKIPSDSLAYIVYMADNIASSADRREAQNPDAGFEIATPLQSTFNLLNGNQQKYYYRPGTLGDGINYPAVKKESYDQYFYTKIVENIKANLTGLEWNQEYINSLLEVLEANLTYIPSSTSKNEVADISLYDHMKLTAATASCIYEYLQEKENKDYRTTLFVKGHDFYKEHAFLLYSMDVSGIQDFIYTITSKNALKTLRARSFYLEIMMEHIIDSLLQRLHLSRANLIYSGGGHCYMLLPNTNAVVKEVDAYVKELNSWLKDTFDIALYVADGYAPCSSDVLKNFPEGAYSDLFRSVGEKISDKKSHRYEVEDIVFFNRDSSENHSRECKVCKRLDRLEKDEICSICKAIEGFSKNILYSEFFAVTLRKSEDSLPLPGGYYLHAMEKESLRKMMAEDDYFVRAYSKNESYSGKHIATKLWVGSYTSGNEFQKMAEMAEGIDRIAVLRADVDNLGQAFVHGFDNPANHNRYVTLSRTATLSRHLSLFFKKHINDILEKPEFSMTGEKEKRNATICYSGGDDVFIVGAWDDVIELAIDLERAFAKYTQNTLTISGGIGVYHSSYPISAIAKEVAGMEDASKELPGKSAITLFEDGEEHAVTDGSRICQVSDGTYTWEEFRTLVFGEKYRAIQEFFGQSEEKGKNFLYNLLELIRNQGDRINFARYVYLLARMEPGVKSSTEEKERYREFSAKMYQWIKNEPDRRELKTAINIYAYITREKERE